MAIKERRIDALVVGAGFGGIYQLYRLLKLGLSVVAIDAASGVGGTWFWNRYPGAMSDTYSFLYRYSWDKEDLQTCPWPRHYVKQPEVLAYLEHIVEKHGLMKHMQLNTELRSAHWDKKGHWRVTCSTGDVFLTRYLVTSLGLLSKQHYPNIPGLDNFLGDLHHTASWPSDADLRGKRVGVLGCGSTGVQVITEIAKYVKELVCFQRTPQYTVPSGDGPVDPEYRKHVNENYDEIFEDIKKSGFAFGFAEATSPMASFTEAERDEIFESLWQQGSGLRFLLNGFSDIATNREANEAACNFIRKKISMIVNDPEKARKLMPTEPYARRPLCDGGYYHQFNRDNVDIVNLKETPITAITSTGVQTGDGKTYDLDVLILATGFDAVDGNYTRLNIEGVDGQSLKDHWTDGPTSYLGCAVPGFPNLFMITGPQGPFCNIPPAIEAHVDFITNTIEHAEEVRHEGCAGVVEATSQAEADWNAACEKAVEGSLFKETGGWIFGRNVPGKTLGVRFYFGGLNNFLAEVRKCVDGGWSGFTVS